MVGETIHRCGLPITKPHRKNRQKRIRHWPILGREAYLIVKLPRWKSLDCYGEPTTTQQVPWPFRSSPNTISFEKKHILLGLGSTVFDSSLRDNAIKLSPGEHAGSPLHPHNTWVFVGADRRVCP